jgi:hypothetical protein
MMNNAVPRSFNYIQETKDDYFLSFTTFYAQTVHKFLAAGVVSSLSFCFEESGVRVDYYNSTNKTKSLDLRFE